jgi:hypothetical protein
MNSSCWRIHEVIHNAAAGMTPEQLEWHPEGKWSAAEILEHLSLTYSGSKIGLDRCAEAGKPSARGATLKDRLSAFVVVKLGYLPSGRQAPKGTVPKGAASSNIFEHFDYQLAAMDEAITRCEERFGGGVKLINHPIIGPLTASEWRKFHLVHAQHHAKQIAQLKQSLAGRK